jgi:hypothetical protein
MILFSILISILIFNYNSYASIEARDSKGNLIFTTNPTPSDTFSIGSSAIFGLLSLALTGIFVYFCFIKRVPRLIDISNKIHNFEISKRVTIIAIVSVLGMYSILMIPDLGKISPYDAEYQWNESYYAKFKAGIEPSAISFRPVTFTLFYISDLLFHNLKAVPFITSIGIMILTYGITFHITKKRFSGILAVIVLTQSPSFLNYATITSYPNFWIFFYFLSLYLMFKNWGAAVVSFSLSVFAKEEALLLLPILLFLAYGYLNIRKKIFLIPLISLIAVRIIFPEQSHTEFTVFSLPYIWSQVSAVFLPLRNDLLILTLLCPFTMLILALRRRKIKESDIIIVSILTTVLHLLVISSVTNEALRGDRFIPLIIFFGMGAGLLFSKNTISQIKEKKIHSSYYIYVTTAVICLIPTIALVFPTLFLYK